MVPATPFIPPFCFFKIAIALCFGAILVWPATVVGQTSKEINYLQLQQMAGGIGPVPASKRLILPVFQKAEAPPQPSSVFLPRWSPDDLPVFCRIEHEIGKYLPVMVKFRLGSVEYVDQLEGK